MIALRERTGSCNACDLCCLNFVLPAENVAPLRIENGRALFLLEDTHHSLSESEWRDMGRWLGMHEGIKIDWTRPTSQILGKSLVMEVPKEAVSFTHVGPVPHVLFTTRCSHLLDDSRCDIYNSPERPDMRAQWPVISSEMDALTPQARAACGYSFSQGE